MCPVCASLWPLRWVIAARQGTPLRVYCNAHLHLFWEDAA